MVSLRIERKTIVEHLIIIGVIVGAAWASYFLMLNYDANSWIITGIYPERGLLVQAFIELSIITGINRWQLVWMFGVLQWFLAASLLNTYLRRMGFNRDRALLGTLIPIVTLPVVTVGFTNMDGFLFFVTLTWFIVVQEKSWGQVPVAIIVSATVLIFTPPVAAGQSMFNPVYFEYMMKKLIMTINVTGLIALAGLQDAPKHYYKNLYLVPIFLIVMFIAVDWFRWWLMAAPIWVPFVLNAYAHPREDDQQQPTPNDVLARTCDYDD